MTGCPTITTMWADWTRMTDDELTDMWESCLLERAITHAEHLRISWVLITRHGEAIGRSRIADGTLRNCVALDAPDKFDADLTARWSEAIATAMRSGHTTRASEFLAEHPELLNSTLYGPPTWQTSTS